MKHVKVNTLTVILSVFMLFAGACGGSTVQSSASAIPNESTTVSAPQNVTAVAGDQQVELNWDAVDQAFKYVIHYGKEEVLPGSDWSEEKVTSNSCIKNNLANGIKYYFVIYAVDIAGNWSDRSEQIEAIPITSNVPQNLIVEAGNEEVWLDWDTMEGAIQYRIYWNNADEYEDNPNTTSATEPPYILPNLTNGERYIFSVTALYENNYETDRSQEVIGYPDFLGEEKIKLVASDRGEGDSFGFAVDAFGSYIVVGAPKDDDNGSDAGAVYIFKNTGDGWEQMQKLTASDGSAGDQFGYSVSIYNDGLRVGAPYYDGTRTDQGAAYYFRYDSGMWVDAGKTTASDADGYDYFGYSVFKDGNRSIIGAPYNDAAGYNAGAVYIYDHYGETKITASDASGSDHFGISLDAGYDDLIVGGDANKSYYFKRSSGSWIEEQILISSEADLGSSAAMSQNWIIVGNPDHGSDSSASIFYNDGTSWLPDQTVYQFEDWSGDSFGHSVKIYEDLSVVTNGSSGAYLYRYDEVDGWMQRGIMYPSNGSPDVGFGQSIAIEWDKIIIGAPYDDVHRGAVYIY